jgi:hypothetical protein
MDLALHATQSQPFRARKRSRFRVLVAGRRWGKSTLAGVELLASVPEANYGRWWYVAPTYEIARDVMWGWLKMHMPVGWLAQKPNESRMEFRFRNHATVQLKSAQDPDNLRGRGLNGVILDEFADMEARIWAEIMLPSLADVEGTALFIGTPKSFNHFYDLYQLGQSGNPDWQSWQFRTCDNSTLPPNVVEDARRTSDSRTFRQEWEASFEALSGRAYYAFARATHVRPVELLPHLAACCSFDFNVDPATAVIGQREGDFARVWREVKLRHAGGEATRACGRRVKELLAEAGFHGAVRIYGDATGRSAKTTGPADHAILRELFPAATWLIGRSNPHERDRIAAVNAVCETMTGARRLVVDPSCLGLTADLEQVVVDEAGELDKSTNPELTHLSDALGYWLAKDFPPAPRASAGSARAEWLL